VKHIEERHRDRDNEIREREGKLAERDKRKATK
jgi:hypothetical protein